MDTDDSATTSLRLVHNPGRDRFELWDSSTFLALLAYERTDGPYTLLHTVVDEDFGHQGVARLLVSMVLTRIRLDGDHVVPVCSYVQRYLRRFPEFRELVAA